MIAANFAKAVIRMLYTEDAVVLPPERELRGRDAIVRYFALCGDASMSPTR